MLPFFAGAATTGSGRDSRLGRDCAAAGAPGAAGAGVLGFPHQK